MIIWLKDREAILNLSQNLFVGLNFKYMHVLKRQRILGLLKSVSVLFHLYIKFQLSIYGILRIYKLINSRLKSKNFQDLRASNSNEMGNVDRSISVYVLDTGHYN